MQGLIGDTGSCLLIKLTNTSFQLVEWKKKLLSEYTIVILYKFKPAMKALTNLKKSYHLMFSLVIDISESIQWTGCIEEKFFCAPNK